MHSLHLSIDHALAVSYRRDVRARDQPKYVARITLVKGVPFYGYHVGYRFFLKIYMFNPAVMTRLADLLQQGSILKRKFQPYEAHLQYLLQFMADYNLYGCSYLEAGKATFRSPVPKHEADDKSPRQWHSQTIPGENITDDVSLPRVSHCSIEVDICVQDINNRAAVKERRLHHDFVERSNPIPSDVKLVHSMAGLWSDETKRRKRRMGNLAPASSPFPPEVLVSMSADPRGTQTQGWIHEAEYRKRVRNLIAEEGERGDGSPVTFETFCPPAEYESSIRTVFESVEDLYPDNLHRALDLPQASVRDHDNAAVDVVVDEEGILGRAQDGDDLYLDDLEEELFRATHSPTDEKNGDAVDDFPAADEETDQRRSNKMPAYLDNCTGSVDAEGYDTSLSATTGGLCESGLMTGRRTQVFLDRGLPRAARTDGLVTKSGRSGSGRTKSDRIEGFSQPKRELSASLEGADGKRRRLELPSAIINGDDPGADQIPEETGLKAPYQPASPTPSHPKKPKDNSARRLNDSRLNFAVVKDPNDPSTTARLSQQSRSQPIDEPAAQKTAVSFAQPPPAVALVTQTAIAQSVLAAKPTASPMLRASVRPLASSIVASRLLVLGELAPSAAEVSATLQAHGVPDMVYQDVYYSNEKDVPVRKREYAGREFRLEGNTVPFLPDFDFGRPNRGPHGWTCDAVSEDGSSAEPQHARQRHQCTLRSWEMAEPPPSFDEVRSWWRNKQKAQGGGLEPSRRRDGEQDNQNQRVRPAASQIEGPTPRNKHGFKYSQKRRSTSVQHDAQYMSTMSLEVHVNTRGRLVPNPEEDAVQCVFWCLKSDTITSGDGSALGSVESGVVVLSEDGSRAQQIRRQVAAEVLEEVSELGILVRVVEVVRTLDPDILTGYEVHGSSWGYLIERARLKYDYNLCDEFSRMKTQSHGRFGKEADRWGFNTTSTIRVTGRHMINVWRAMRGELNLLQYTMENVVWNLLHRRIPHHSHRTLSDWWAAGRPRDQAKVLRHYLARARLDIEILEGNELIARTSEQARLLGVDFFSVFSRGSQFKVESIMFRIAKPENLLLVSPNRKQVGGQNALECLPLVMEPQSAFYTSPVLVLDFQSLYPSVMIAYNYCYSTFLGRIVRWRGSTDKMGFTEYRRRERLLELLGEHVNIAPNGMMYVRSDVRKSLLAKMLTEILETRVMVKSGMKQDRDDRTLQQLLNNRQLALKLLANVTYGYASASSSGRMPCSEIADSIVQTGRETLERAIAYIHSVDRWRAEVVYGDTDSLFVHLEGRTRDQAFAIGEEIARAVTDMNPRPVRLKFEKVYHPCVLLAKKRYVGYKYESPEQTTPEFDAKGIETVRRDGTPAEQKIEEKALRLLFETADLSCVKAYFQGQCSKIMSGAVSVQDFCFAKEVRLGTYSDRGLLPPGALVSTRRMLEDSRAEPQYGERVPYVVVTGAPGTRLVDRCVAPEDLLASPYAQLDAEYYITKNIVPPLERIFNLVGVNVKAWYDEMPKVQRARRVEGGGAAGEGDPTHNVAGAGKKFTLESYLRLATCLVCGVKLKAADGRPICRRCGRDAPASIAILQQRLRNDEQRLLNVEQVCRSCAGLSPLDEVKCDSKDCPVFYTRTKQGAHLRSGRSAIVPLIDVLTHDVMPSLEW